LEQRDAVIHVMDSGVMRKMNSNEKHEYQKFIALDKTAMSEFKKDIEKFHPIQYEHISCVF
jgi:hypothetical protein